MTLKKLLFQYRSSISEISALAASINACNDDIKKVSSTVIKYHKIYTKLLKMKPRKNNSYVRVYKIVNVEFKNVYVDGYKTHPDKDSYALEFEPWNEWLGMGVVDCIDNEKMALAHCLWEMTFRGFDEKIIQKERKKIREIVKSIKNGTAKLVSSKEVFKKLGKKSVKKKK